MKRYPIPWRLNCAIVMAQVAAAFGIFWLAALATAWWQLAVLTLAMAIVGNSLYASLHEAEHGMLLPIRFYNDFLGALLGLFFPAPFHLLRQGHLGHHLRNRSDDEAFDYYFPGENAVWKRLQFYGVLTGLFWLVIVCSSAVVLVWPGLLRRRKLDIDRPTAALVESLNPRYWRLIRLEALAVFAFHAAIVALLHIPLLSYCAVYCGFAFVWSGMQYVHHFGTERHVTAGAKFVAARADRSCLAAPQLAPDAPRASDVAVDLSAEEIGRGGKGARILAAALSADVARAASDQPARGEPLCTAHYPLRPR